jgi:hypothetical protein
MGAPDLSRQPDPRWNTGAAYRQAPPEQAYQSGSGGSFLGTAAAAAAGVVGGAVLMHGISSLFGHSGSAHAKAFDPGLSGGGDQSSPWGGGGGDLARQAGLDDIGRSPGTGGADGPAGLFGNADDPLGNAADFDGGDFGAGDE